MSAEVQLKSLLAQGDVGLSFEGLTDVILGVLAAPPQHRSNDWIALICADPSVELMGALQAYKGEMDAQLVDTLGASKKRSARLKALRNEMSLFDVDGFLIPKADEHQGEYVSQHAERLMWLTGFTGSAGFALVMAKEAAIFIDGRYTIQVQNEVDGSLFEYCHVSNDPAPDWLGMRLEKGMKIAYDPWFHTGPSLHRLKEACQKKGAQLVAAPHNFIDALWENQPPRPLSPVFPQILSYAGTDHNDKLNDIAKSLKEAQQDAMVLSLPDSIAWLFNIRASDIPCTPVALGFAIVYGDATADLFMDGRKILAQTRDHLGAKVRLFEPDDFANNIDELGRLKKTVRLDGRHAPVWIEERLKKAGALLQVGDDLCILPKACKNKVELEGMRKAHRRDGVAMVRFLHWLSAQPFGPDLNEMSVSNKVDGFRRENDGFYDLSFPTISGAGENGAIVHYRVDEDSSLPLPENGLHLLDSGAQYIDGTTDITRTIARGTPSLEMKDRFTRVLKGHIAISSQRFPEGTTGSQIDVLARLALWQVGLDYDHGTGHGVGTFLNVHEGPHSISKMPNRVAFQPGMVVSNEPGYYKNGAYGIRIENLIYVRRSEKGENEERDMLEFEPLSLCPIDLNAIEVSLLNSFEKDWLNDYHQRVYTELSPLLQKDDAAWLVKATREI